MTAAKGFEPTKAQKNAIEATGGAITVSAAAGSGKTRVLVQRVIRHLTEERIPADRLLILTFTNTAAQEMRTRISRAIDELIAKEPSNNFYRRQQLLLASSDICTIDSFCSRIVRENFFRLGISKDYRIGSETELHELRRRIMSDLIEEFYTPPEGDENSDEYKKAVSQYEAFGLLSMTLTDAKLDNDLENCLLAAYDKYSSHAFPEIWMKNCIAQYHPDADLNKSPAALFLIKKLKESLTVLKMIFKNALFYRSHISEQYSLTKKKYYGDSLDAYDSYEYFLENLEDQLSESKPDIDSIAGSVNEFKKISIKYGATKDQELKKGVSYLNDFASVVSEYVSEYVIFTTEEFKKTNKNCYPVILCLNRLLEEFDNRFFAAKSEKGILDFHDLERLMLHLLYEKNDGGEYVRTEYAAELSEIYEEIMIDEYQDTNDIQESIFKAISKNEENLFVVGDIKQSIYRFRDAQPELFKKRCEKSRIYDENDPHFPALIILDKNFRSREGIIDSVNYMFSLLMSDDAGEIEYDDTQRLTAGAVYPQKNDGVPDTEVHFVQFTKSDQNGQKPEDDSIDNANKAEAKYCASLIKQMVKDGFQVTDSGKLRNAEYSDFCILLRAVRNKAHIYSEELKKAGISACTDTETDLLEKYEIRAAVSYLKILNNPLSDVDMAASLLCPVFGFTPDEAAEIKEQKQKRYYKKLLAKANDDDSLGRKCKSFLDDLRYFRTYAVTASCDKLLMEILEKTGFSCAVLAMQDGTRRLQNLRKLISFAADYENSTGGGLTGFIRHIRYLEESGSGIKVSDNVPENAVRIMTIHHSKGLEFPICILAGTKTSRNGNSDKINFHPKYGIGLRAVDDQTLYQYNTIQYKAISTAEEDEEKSEQMRVLYVAMTRAKEKLIILSTLKGNGKTDGEYDESYINYLYKLLPACKLVSNGKFFPFDVMSCRNYSDWIMMCMMVSSKLDNLRNAINDSDIVTVSAPDILYRYCTDIYSQSEEKIYSEPEQPSEELLKKLDTMFKEAEETDITTLIPSKVSASMLAHRDISSEFVAAVKPAFTRKGRISPTQRGLATHAFLEYADFSKLYTEIKETGSFENEKQRITELGFMPQDQTDLIEEDTIKAFVKTDLFGRMLRSKNLYREYRFTVSVPAGMTTAGNDELTELLNNTETSATSVLQGAIDCIFEEEDGMVIVDYKTDHVKEPSVLTERYSTQLRLYEEAAQKLFDKPVKQRFIYSLHCEAAILL